MINDMSKFVFFTTNDFELTDGGTIRMNGILEALIEHGHTVTLISNIKDIANSIEGVRHIPLDIQFSKFQRRLIMLFISIFPFALNRFFLLRHLHRLKQFFSVNDQFKDIIFFEYFDNCTAYILTNLNIIRSSTLDVHGVADLEFQFKPDASLVQKIVSKLKLTSSILLDRKVFRSADKIIALNEVFRDYFLGKYDFLSPENFLIVDDGLTMEYCNQRVDSVLLDTLRSKYNIDDKTFVAVFAGSFKSFGGVPDLVNAFIAFSKLMENTALVLIGGGEDEDQVNSIVDSSGLKNIHLVGRTKYGVLRTYFELADVIVCPDRKHPYSDMIVHTKYYEALASGKIVINGDFPSTRLINKNDILSLSFEPSSVDDLEKKIRYAYQNFAQLSIRYAVNRETVFDQFSYINTVKGLL